MALRTDPLGNPPAPQGGAEVDALGDQPARQMNPFGVHSVHHPHRGDLSARTDAPNGCAVTFDLFDVVNTKIVSSPGKGPPDIHDKTLLAISSPLLLAISYPLLVALRPSRLYQSHREDHLNFLHKNPQRRDH